MSSTQDASVTGCNDPKLKSWVQVPAGSDFPIQNLPFGVFRSATISPRAGVAIGQQIVDLVAVSGLGLFSKLDADLGVPVQNMFSQPSLNAFLGLGRPAWRAVRARVSELLREGNTELACRVKESGLPLERVLLAQADVEMLLPVRVENYVDFYSSEEHATNIGKMVRDPSNPLLPNWRHIPIGYNGRANSVVVSGTPFHRPNGQTKPPNAETPLFGPCKSLDFELEVATIIGRGTRLGESVSPDEAEDVIFGFALLNDWSARDIQTWEYQPLGPFLAKSFCTSLSPWVVTLDALEPFRVAGPMQNPPVLPYLRYSGAKSFDITLDAFLQGAGEGEEQRICRTNFRAMYFNAHQQVAHLSSNGTPLSPGDVYGSGTVSGTTPDSFGSMMELTWRGANPIALSDGSARAWIQDGDTIVLRGAAEKDGVRVGFGEVRGTVLPARAVRAAGIAR